MKHLNGYRRLVLSPAAAHSAHRPIHKATRKIIMIVNITIKQRKRNFKQELNYMYYLA